MKYEGPIREIITTLAALFAAMNLFPQTALDTLAGLLVAGAMVIYGVIDNQGFEKVFTLARKALSLLPAALLHFDVLPKEVVMQLALLLPPVAAIVWSHFGKGELPPTKLP